MESLISLIVVGIIIFNIVRSNKGTGKSPGNSSRQQMPPSSRNIQQSRPQQASAPARGNEWNPGRSLAERKEVQEKKTEMYSESDKALIEKGKEQSTTEYLKQKADFDEMEHNREREQEQKRQKDYNLNSGFTTAERLVIGDSVPNDRRVLKCNYCGADNLVPVNIRSKYSCYFCREAL